MFKYDNHHDANQYLSGTYMSYEGQPTYITEVNSDMAIIHKPLESHEYILGDIEKLSPEQLQLGYAYDGMRNHCYYFERMPSRSFRQGISRTNTRTKGDRGSIGGINDVAKSELNRMFTNNYRSSEESIAIAKSSRSEVPFHRSMSVDWNSIVRWKTQVVGELTDGKVRLMARFIYLKETIEDEGYTVC